MHGTNTYFSITQDLNALILMTDQSDPNRLQKNSEIFFVNDLQNFSPNVLVVSSITIYRASVSSVNRRTS